MLLEREARGGRRGRRWAADGAGENDAALALYRPRYNIAPAQEHIVLRRFEGRARSCIGRWGLPVREPGKAASINVRAETVASQTAFREALASRRCVVRPMASWKEDRPEGRQPLWFHQPDGHLLLLAGLFDEEPPGGEPVAAYALRGADHGGRTRCWLSFHSRMPVLLSASAGAIGACCLSALLIAAPSDSPVADAAMHDKRDEVRTLLKQGADVNAAQGDGLTALHWAALKGDVELAQMLVYAGANLKATTRLDAFTPLLMAAKDGDAAMVEALVNAGADTNAATTNGTTPLMFASASGSVKAVETLLSHGAKVNAAEHAREETPLIFAAANGRTDVIRALVAHGADVKATTKVVDLVGATRKKSWSVSRRSPPPARRPIRASARASRPRRPRRRARPRPDRKARPSPKPTPRKARSRRTSRTPRVPTRRADRRRPRAAAAAAVRPARRSSQE